VNQKLQTRAFENVTPMLQPGEVPVVAARTMVGAFSGGRLGMVVKQAIVLEGGGSVLAQSIARTQKQFVVVTDRRLIFLPQTFLGGPGKKAIGEVPRAAVTLAEVTMGMVSLVRLAFGTAGEGVSLTFPRQDKKAAEALVAVLQQSPVA
jgi:hypothetical protein